MEFYTIPKICEYIPIISGIFCFLTIIITYIISRSLNHYPKWMYLPVISLMGYKMPERIIYAIGFTLGGFGYFFIAIHYVNGMKIIKVYKIISFIIIEHIHNIEFIYHIVHIF